MKTKYSENTKSLPQELQEAADGIFNDAETNKSGVNRRDFIKLSSLASGGLLVAFTLGLPKSAKADDHEAGFKPNGFLHIQADGTIIIYATNPEVGQGVKTSLPMIVAEELEVPWDTVTVKQSGISQEKFGRQAAGGSRATPVMWTPLRQAAATARVMLIAAAAKQWGVSATECMAKAGKVHHKESGKTISYPELAESAAKLKVPDPESVTLKDRKDYTLLGKWIPGVDNKDIVTGKSLFGIDEDIPGMVYASYVKCPHFEGKVKSANIDRIKKLDGIKDAFVVEGNGKPDQLLSGVAIIADSTWAAFEAQKRLKVDWDLSEASRDSWKTDIEKAKEASMKEGDVRDEAGDVESAFKEADQVIENFYTYQFASHANLEPQNCTAHWRDGMIELWAPTQTPQWLEGMIAGFLEIDKSKVLIHQKRIGGGFGRRLLNDYAVEAAHLSRVVGKPVKLTWTREQDMAHDFFRVGGFHRSKAGIDANGKLSAYQNHFVTYKPKGADEGDTVRGGNMGTKNFPFPAIANRKQIQTTFETQIPCGWWRAPGSCTLAWSIQSFLHEISTAAKRDHLEFLVELFEDLKSSNADAGSINPDRAISVIKLAAEKGGWENKLPEGKGRGLAFYYSHSGHFAEVVELSVSRNKKVKLDRVVVAGDVGLIVNRSGAENQVEGSVIDGLSTMAMGEITYDEGKVDQSNFHNYNLMRIPAQPKIDVHFIESDYSPTGLGEPALPPLAPAVCNAIYEVTGERITTLPFTHQGFELV